jgi:hypothetical protein
LCSFTHCSASSPTVNDWRIHIEFLSGEFTFLETFLSEVGINLPFFWIFVIEDYVDQGNTINTIEHRQLILLSCLPLIPNLLTGEFPRRYHLGKRLSILLGYLANNVALGRLSYDTEELLLVKTGNRRCLGGSVLVFGPVDGRFDFFA